MKFIFIGICLFFIVSKSVAQLVPDVAPTIKSYFISKDSVNLLLDGEYYLVLQGCAIVTRCTHIDTNTQRFIGKFKDVSRDEPSRVINEGNYNKDGQKDGEFILHYFNGNLMAQGSFKNNRFIGKWEFYYQDGSPEVVFSVTDGVTTIQDAWDENKVKIVSDGNGNYVVTANNSVTFRWTGKIVNGRPDGTWTFTDQNTSNTADLNMHEYFKKGKFTRGKNPIMSYDDNSHFELIDSSRLTFINAEKFGFLIHPCRVVPTFSHVPVPNDIVNMESARYDNGNNELTAKIQDAISPFVKKWGRFQSEYEVNAVIDEKGNIGNFRNGRSSVSLPNDLIRCLEDLPILIPATVNKKPAKQKFKITIRFQGPVYNLAYEFLEVERPETN